MDQVAQVREKIDIVALISEYIPLKKAGRNFKANCPFHNEKTPSFVISAERQIWHCFGCGKGGDCFTFLMLYESLEFPEALRILAKKAGIELKFSDIDTGASSKKEKIYKLNRLTMDFYHYLLTKHNVGKKALEYLTKERKLNLKIIESFMLGYSPRIGNSLSKFLLEKKKYMKEDLIEAGLSFPRNGQMMDFFVNRLMFPLFDHRGNIIGFSGRIMSQGQQISKYVNTKETLTYRKGEVFFGLNVAKDEIKKENWAIIMEGEFDVISSFQAGIKNAIAVKGTALTQSQAQLISRFSQKVSLCFDQDNAGQEATKRSLSALQKRNLTITVIEAPNGKDPDESIKEDEVAFKKSLKNDVDVYDYLLKKLTEKFNRKTVDGKKKISEEILPVIGEIENEIVKEHYFKKIGEILEISYESIVKQTEKIQKEKIVKVENIVGKEKRKRTEILEEYLLALIIQSSFSKVILSKIIDILREFEFENLAYRKILSQLNIYFSSHEKFNPEEFLAGLNIEIVPAFDSCFLYPIAPLSLNKTEEEATRASQELRFLYLREKIKELGLEIKNKEKEGNPDLDSLKQEFSKLLLLLPRK